MRVSNNQIIGSSLQAMQQQGADILKYQKQIASGNRFAKASEGAVELARGVQLQFEQSRYEMLKRNQDVVATRAALTYTQLDTMTQVLLSLQEMAARATFPGLDSSSMAALHAEATVAFDTLKNLAKSTGVAGDGSGYLLSGLTAPQLNQPQVRVTPATPAQSASLDPSAIFSSAGTYTISGYNAEDGSIRLQIDGKGPDGTNGTYYIGTFNGADITFPQYPGRFQNLVLTPSDSPAGKTYQFAVNDLKADISADSRFYDSGSYEVKLSVVGATLSAELFFDDGDGASAVKTVTAVPFDITAGSVTLDFGDINVSAPASPPPYVRDLSFTISGDLTTLRSADSVTFSVLSGPSSLPVEPGISLPEGLSYAQVMRRPEQTQDIIADVEGFIEGLKDLISTPPHYASTMSNISGYAELLAARDHIMTERTRAGSIAAQVDIARSSLEAKGIELDGARARLLETDIAEASTKLVQAQTLLQAAQSIFSRLQSSNLFQRLG